MSSGRSDRLTSCMTINRGSREKGNLLAAARAGDQHAFGRLASHHRPGLELYCRLMLGCPEDAREAVQETLQRGWRDLDRVPASASARIRLYRLATDVCLEDLDRTDESREPQPFDPTKGS
jgi:DNA-directed RNA polymerase specialized sigma24 family protein